MAYKFDNTVDITKFIDTKNVNSKYLYGTLVVYGDLTIKDQNINISCKADRIWVRGKLTIENCTGSLELPTGEIDADSIDISRTPNIVNYPEKMIADSVRLTSISGGASLSSCEIFARTYFTDNQDLIVDPAKAFGIVIQEDKETKQALVYDHRGSCVWKASNSHIASLKEHGYLKNIYDLKEVESFCKEAELLPSDAKLFSYSDAKHVWENSMDKNKDLNSGNTFSAGY